MNAGIDYGIGQANVDLETGIRFGVISQNEVGQAWFDSSESDYGEPTCPECGNPVIEFDGEKHDEFEGRFSDFACEFCKQVFDSSEVYPEYPFGFYLDDGEYKAEQSGEDTDIFILKSPFYTFCAFCSPCAPGAGYLLDVRTEETGIKAYCFGHDWFADGVAPYPVYSVESGELIEPNKE